MSRALAAACFLPFLVAAGLPHAQGTCEADGYTVMRGDTLYSIARLCGSDVATVARASGLADPAKIEVGQKLIIPGRHAPARAAQADRQGEPREGDGHGYRMARGDTLYSLARRTRVSLRALIEANPGIDARRIEIGDEVRLPAGARDRAPVARREYRHEAAPHRHSPPSAPPAEPEDKDEPEPEGM